MAGFWRPPPGGARGQMPPSLRYATDNHNYMVKQNDVLFKLVREVSVNVSEISDKIRILEQKFCVIEKAVKHNNNEIVEVQHKVEI